MGTRTTATASRPVRGGALTWTADDDAFLRWNVRRGTLLQRWDTADCAGVLQLGRTGAIVLTVVGIPEAAARLVTEVVTSNGRQPHRVTLPRGSVEVLARTAPEVATRLVEGAEWEWMWTSTAPPGQPGEDRVLALDTADEAGITALLATASPRHTAVPGGRGIERWVGVRDERGLVAVGANEPICPPVPHLASIATLPEVRGRGLGAAVTSSLTRSLLDEGHPVVTLGMYSDNPVARRVYERLGFRCDHRFSSRAIAPAGEANSPMSSQPEEGRHHHDHQ